MTFFYIPFSGLDAMVIPATRCLAVGGERAARRRVRNQASGQHDICCASASGFSVDNSARILDRETQINLAEYISRPPISLKKIRYEPFKGRVLFHRKYSDYFRPTQRVGPK